MLTLAGMLRLIRRETMVSVLTEGGRFLANAVQVKYLPVMDVVDYLTAPVSEVMEKGGAIMIVLKGVA